MSEKNVPNEFFSTRNLTLHYRTSRGAIQAVDDVDLDIARGHSLVVLGESGCGKSSLARAILRLLPRNIERWSGSIMLDGKEIGELSEEEFRKQIRWRKISLVPQASMNALNPVMSIEDQAAEPHRLHLGSSREESIARIHELFTRVGLPREFFGRYPFELSGGMRQRAVIAMALVTNASLVILDEPTSALDVLTQANILNTLKELKRDFGTSFMLITHDVGTSSEIADDVAVIYAGEIDETAPAKNFFSNPLHPYSKALMASVPKIGSDVRPSSIPGTPPSLASVPSGCRFADRCPFRFEKCSEHPPLMAKGPDRKTRCWLE